MELRDYFAAGVSGKTSDSVGIEVETSFTDESAGIDTPITFEKSQLLFAGMVSAGWSVTERKNGAITALRNNDGDTLTYELGRQNLEISAAPCHKNYSIGHTQRALETLYEAGRAVLATPRFKPVLSTNEDLLAVPDERDARWIEIDGRKALCPLATISSVQFTIEIPAERAIVCLNRLGEQLPRFLDSYEQESVWRTYVKESNAGYDPSRYGGPIFFDSIEDYCEKLAMHDVVGEKRLVRQSPIINVPLFVRSIWWYFRLRRYGERLCIEVRPVSRRDDFRIASDLKMVLDILNL